MAELPTALVPAVAVAGFESMSEDFRVEVRLPRTVVCLLCPPAVAVGEVGGLRSITRTFLRLISQTSRHPAHRSAADQSTAVPEQFISKDQHERWANSSSTTTI